MDSIIDRFSFLKSAEKGPSPEAISAISERLATVATAAEVFRWNISREHPAVIAEAPSPESATSLDDRRRTAEDGRAITGLVNDSQPDLSEKYASGVADLSAERARRAVEAVYGGFGEAA